MQLKTFLIGVTAVALVAGFLGLVVPVSAPIYQGNDTAACGSALAPDYSEAANRGEASETDFAQTWGRTLSADLSGDFVESCQSSITVRRAWSWPVAVLGVVLLAGLVLIRAPVSHGRHGTGA